MEITTVIVICIIGALLSMVLRQYKPEYAMLLSMACGVVVILYLMEGIGQIGSELQNMLQTINLPPELLEVLFKGIGICVLSELAAESCRDAGEGAIALKAELAGKVAIMVISMPLFLRLLNLAAGLLSVVG